MVVREGRPDDADALAGIHGRSWHHAYEDVLPYDELTKYDLDDRRRIWTGVLTRGPGSLGEAGHDVLVATTADGVPRGFASFGPARDADREEDGELSTLYVDPPAQGAGVGRLLHDAALDRLRVAGFAHAIVWVFEENGHGLLFYARAGWVADGEPRQLEGWAGPAVRLRRALAAP